MASAVNTGSLNMPKMLRHLSHRSSQVRNLTFIRDPIYRKVTKTTKGTSNNALAGPAVNFGYETDSYAAQAASANTAYHINSPELILPGLKMLQSPITSRSGNLERTGHRITGACTFYAPSMSYIKSLPNFTDAVAFSELESYDKLIDIERIIHHPVNISVTSNAPIINFDSGTAGYEIDRIQFKIKTATNVNFQDISLVINDAGTAKLIRWQGDNDIPLVAGTTYTFDAHFREIKSADSYDQWIDGVAYNMDSDIYLNGTTTGTTYSLDTLYGDTNNELVSLKFTLDASVAVEVTDIYLYKEAEWRVDSIQDYRDEYMKIGAVRVRGDRTSRRRAYG